MHKFMIRLRILLQTYHYDQILRSIMIILCLFVWSYYAYDYDQDMHSIMQNIMIMLCLLS